MFRKVIRINRMPVLLRGIRCVCWILNIKYSHLLLFIFHARTGICGEKSANKMFDKIENIMIEFNFHGSTITIIYSNIRDNKFNEWLKRSDRFIKFRHSTSKPKLHVPRYYFIACSLRHVEMEQRQVILSKRHIRIHKITAFQCFHKSGYLLLIHNRWTFYHFMSHFPPRACRH